MNNITRATKPDAQGFDEVRIFTKPRYKTSGLSGDEWRISGVCQIIRKGKIVEEFSMSNVENCAKVLPYKIMVAGDEGKFFYAGEGDICDQEGCAQKATVFYKLKKHYCSCRGGCGKEQEKYGDTYRAFCGDHSRRGDCGIEDSDANYELIDGMPVEPKDEHKSPSVFGGVIQMP